VTDSEKQAARALKEAVSKELAAISVEAYNLTAIDYRLEVYARGLIMSPEKHNLWELLALRRFFEFLKIYEFRINEVQNYIIFYESLKFDGLHGRTRYKMTPVQVFQFANIMGFYTEDGKRLIRDVLLFVPRKFAKTTSVTSFAIYDLLVGDANAQAYTAANSYEQAQICFREIKEVLKGLDPQLKSFKLKREKVEWIDTAASGRTAFVRCLASKADTLDGLNASTVIMDEYSQADSSELYGVLTTSMGARLNPLTIVITTASDKPNAPFVSMLNRYKSILRGEVENDRVFAHIFEPDVDDAPDDPATWAKVQPHLGITVQPDYYAAEWERAQTDAEAMKTFLTKMLNIFVSGNSKPWIEGATVRDHSEQIDITTLGAPADCEVGIDLSVDNDFSAVSYFIYLKNRKQGYIKTDYYFPKGQLATHPNRELYKKWAEAGYLHLCEGNIIDYQQIVKDIWGYSKYLRIWKFGYDRYKSAEFRNTLIAWGASKDQLFDYSQTAVHFTAPVLAMSRGIEKNYLVFEPNPITQFCFDNAVLVVDNMGNAKPFKKNDSEKTKIDGVITSLMALGMADNQVRKG
jgi:phage terminase large subunit-like protein